MERHIDENSDYTSKWLIGIIPSAAWFAIGVQRHVALRLVLDGEPTPSRPAGSCGSLHGVLNNFFIGVDHTLTKP
jgi:hypothetical protein